MENKLKQEECGISVNLWGNHTKFIHWNYFRRKPLWKIQNFVKTSQSQKNANRVTLIIYIWLKCLIFRVFELNFANQRDGQEIKISTRMNKFHFWVKYTVLTKTKTKFCKILIFATHDLHDILDDDHIQWHPQLIGHYTNFWPLLIWTLLPNLTFYRIVQGFHRTYATGAACQQRMLTPPDTWSCPTLGLACVLMSRPLSPEHVLCPDFWISNIPRYFSFCLWPYSISIPNFRTIQ